MKNAVLLSVVLCVGLLLRPASLRADDSNTASADKKLPRWEAGPFVSVTTFGTAVSVRNVKTGCGGRLTVNLTPFMAVEYQMAHFSAGSSQDAKTQGSGHLKLTYRAENHRTITIFAIVGPGFLRESYSYTSRYGTTVYRFHSAAFDYGAGIEIVPGRRCLMRLDLTDFYTSRS